MTALIDPHCSGFLNVNVILSESPRLASLLRQFERIERVPDTLLIKKLSPLKRP